MTTGVGVGLVALFVGQIRLGGYVIAATFAALAVVRAGVSPERLGAVVVRSRPFDVVILLVASISALVVTAALLL
ncbi:MAG: DUF3017 domain-containing protein [Actinomycetota bacterium]